MTDREKINAILKLLVDRNVGELEKSGQIQGDDERFGALVFAGHTLNKAIKIANKGTRWE